MEIDGCRRSWTVDGGGRQTEETERKRQGEAGTGFAQPAVIVEAIARVIYVGRRASGHAGFRSRGQWLSVGRDTSEIRAHKRMAKCA